MLSIENEKFQKQPSWGVLRKRCSENIQHIYLRIPMPKCDLIKLLCNFIEIAPWHGCSPVKLLHILRTPFLRNTSEGLLLKLKNSFRSSHQRCSVKKGVLRNFEKSTGKHLCQSLFLVKLHARSATLLKKRLWHRCFHVNFAKFLRTPLFGTPLDDRFYNFKSNNTTEAKWDVSCLKRNKQVESIVMKQTPA